MNGKYLNEAREYIKTEYNIESIQDAGPEFQRLISYADALMQEADVYRSALLNAVDVIQTWHNTDLLPKERSEMWDIYWRNSPEMKPIREALRGEMEPGGEMEPEAEW